MLQLAHPQTDRSTSSLRQWGAFFVVILFVVAYKSTDALSHPQFWAEDATVFFKDQFGNALPQLFTPYAGYLHTLPRLVAWLASWLPAAKAPLIYNAGAILLCAAAITLTCRRLSLYVPVWVVALSFLAVPTSSEIFGTITNAQWFLQFTMAAYCLTPPEKSTPRWLTWARAVAIALIALTGPFSMLLLMVILGVITASFLSKRLGLDPFNGALSGFIARRDGPVLGALALGALVQAYVLVTHPPAQHEVAQPLLTALHTTFTQIVPNHIFGGDFLIDWVWIALYALIICTLIGSRKVNGTARLVVLGFLALAAVECFLPMLRIPDLEQIRPLPAADRYFYLIKVVWWWSVWLALTDGSRRSRYHATVATTALICFFAVTNLQYMRRAMLTEQDWPVHAAELAQPGTHTIPVNPPGWSITVESSGDEASR